LETPEKSDAIMEHQEVPKAEAAVETIWALEDQYEDQHPAIGDSQRNEPKAVVGPGRNW
jgi:hypothetical protein